MNERDIVERLRKVPGRGHPCPTCKEAADEIEKLHKADDWHRSGIAERDAEIERLREVVRQRTKLLDNQLGMSRSEMLALGWRCILAALWRP